MTNDNDERRTDERDTENREADRDTENRDTVKDIDHTHPHTSEPFGENGVYERGSESPGPEDEDEDETAETDGGRRTDRRTARERDHRPPGGNGVQPSFDRGGESPDRR